MTSTMAAMPSINPNNTDHHHVGAEAGSRGFTAINITPPQSRGMHEQRTATDRTNDGSESSPASANVSPRHNTSNATPNFYMNGHNGGPPKKRRSTSPGQDLLSPRRYDYHPPRNPQHMADRALHVLDTSQEPSQSYHEPSRSYYSTTPAGGERQSYAYDRPYAGSNGAYSNPEGRVADAFSRELSEQHYASSGNGIDPDRPEDANDRNSSQHVGQKRKRNFTNRTKTGCKTCRERKKKCDEARPHCNNCIRGSFQCKGYDQTRPGNWPPKPVPQKQPIPLQSKENDELAPYETATPISADPSSAEASIRPNRSGEGHDPSRPGGPQYAPHSAAPANSRPPFPGHQQHQNQWPPANTQHASTSHTYSQDHLPPLSEVARPEAQQQHRPAYTNNTPAREMSKQPSQSQTTAPAQWPPQQPPSQPQSQPPPQAQTQPSYQSASQQQQQQEYTSRPYPPRIDTLQHPSAARINTANTATTASASYTSYEAKAGSKVFLTEDVERSRMLRGAPYNYFDPTLRNERQRCASALLRYNNACQLGSGISEMETQAMLLKVFDPKLDTTHSFAAPCRIEGHLGPSVKIEPGFRCTYGYNIRIFDNVFVGENTRIDDAAKVDIGARTWIGANVTILTNDVAKDMVQRKGTDGQQCSAQPVVIGSEVVIGTGAVIYPGVKLGRGSTVEPFAVVKENLSDFALQKVFVGQQMPPGAGGNMSTY